MAVRRLDDRRHPVLGVLTLAMVARAASIGGQIRHPEIMLDETAVAPLA